MQTLLASEFNITDVESFRSLLTKTGGVVAGSAVLAAKTGTFTPNDLDIWVRYNQNIMVQYADDRFDTESVTEVYTNELLKLGYKPAQTSFTARDYHSYKTIVKIHQYANDNGKIIQVIFTTIPPIPNIDTFDFDICQFYWNAETDTISGPAGLEGPDGKIKSFRYIKGSRMDEKTKKRKEKYETRGFVFAQ
jgi:hypothetical protein